MNRNEPNDATPDAAPDAPHRHFIQQIIDMDVASGKWGAPGDRSVVKTRFPPEPNGFLHVGHPKSIVLNFSIAAEFGGSCNLRFDDTNPEKEEQAYVDSIIDSVRWLGYQWPGCVEHATPGEPAFYEGVRFASDYFEQMHAWACELIERGLAYVDEQTPEQIKLARGDVKKPGTLSPFRDRPAPESLAEFRKMTEGAFPDGSRVLRARIDADPVSKNPAPMASPNMNLRDPVMYRILNRAHHRTGATWHVYPMYDWAHGLEDSIEGITHSLCTLEFEAHRPLYDWFIRAINGEIPSPGAVPGVSRTAPREPRIHHPQQIEFARLNPTYIVTSKRKLRQLVEDGHVTGWDDPRMPTVSGLRRRGVTPEAVRTFCAGVGVTKFNAVHDVALLENAVREHLNKVAPRRMAVLDPLKVTITNWDRETEWFDIPNNPENAADGTRRVPFDSVIWIERGDFMEDAPNKFFRLKPGGEVRLRGAYWIRCNEVIKNDAGEIIELRCTYDPQTRGGDNPPPDAEGKVRKVKGTLHWVSVAHAVEAEVRLIDRLFLAEQPGKRTGDPVDDLNPESLKILNGCKLEPSFAAEGEGLTLLKEPGWSDGIRRFQFERLGYFCLDPDSTPGRPVFNRTVNLKDSWAKANK
ncbi:MAG: glutamine--tRNA ligase/YqeY domain fusion protein [Phycisphaerales bacterium]|nr:MAG: glutamine--tRNA ligase/YqeY domain fusion protein [Phycisphaerales bacterium]